MNRTYHILEYQKAQLHYSSYGRGKRVLLCFHGYGQSNEHFKALERILGEEYLIYGFDLFYHGKSFWHEKEKPLSKEFWKGLMLLFLEKNELKSFDVLGFSFGGKFALATLELFYKKISKIILIAPEGVKNNFWYSIATKSVIMRRVFRNMIVKPAIFFSLVKILGKLKLVDNKVLKFANAQMATRKQRRRVYYSWVVFRDLSFDMNIIAALINQNNIKLELFLGEYDKLIRQENLNGLLKRLDNYSLNVLPVGHSNLIDGVAEYYRKNLIPGSSGDSSQLKK